MLIDLVSTAFDREREREGERMIEREKERMIGRDKERTGPI